MAITVVVTAGWAIDEYSTGSGRRPLQEFYASLKGKDRADFAAVVKALAKFGSDLRLPHSKSLGGGLLELRSGRIRIFYVFSGTHRATLLHAYLKQGQKAPKVELNMARKRHKEVADKSRD